SFKGDHLMTLQAVWEFAQNHWFLSLVVGVFAVGFFSTVADAMGFHLWYLVVLAAAAIISWTTGYPLYFWPFLLGMTTAFAEIISRFDDEPMKALKTLPALVYHVLNGLISVFALYFLALAAGLATNFD